MLYVQNVEKSLIVMKANLKIDYATHAAAKYACENWHYSKRIPVNKLLKYAIYENDVFIGVIIYGVGASAVLGNQFGLKNIEVCELVRIALKKHENEVSKMIGITLKLLKRKEKGIKVVVSFADTNENHHGGIYQASNWIYTGISSKTLEYFYNGKWRHVTDVYKRLKPEKIKTLPKREKPGKYRYVFPLDKEMKEFCIKLSKPYPKRVSGVESDISGVHPEEGGAVPTDTLQNINGEIECQA